MHYSNRILIMLGIGLLVNVIGVVHLDVILSETYAEHVELVGWGSVILLTLLFWKKVLDDWSRAKLVFDKFNIVKCVLTIPILIALNLSVGLLISFPYIYSVFVGERTTLVLEVKTRLDLHSAKDRRKHNVDLVTLPKGYQGYSFRISEESFTHLPQYFDLQITGVKTSWAIAIQDTRVFDGIESAQ